MAELWSVDKEERKTRLTDTIVDVSEPLTLIGGGEVSLEDLETAMALAPLCVAADSGADAAISAGVALTAVIGDMDSISEDAKAQIPADRYHQIAEQNSTDFEKALRSISAPLILAVGFTGGRVDHGLSAMHTLALRCHQSVVMLTREDVLFLCPKRLSLPMPEGARVSLFPIGPVTGRSTGLHWPIEGLEFAPGVLSGTSNRATGPLDLEMDAPAMLCILPRGFIQPVVSALRAMPPHARWPARAEQHRDLRQS